MSTVTLTTRELAKLVAPVIPHASQDMFTPVLNGILIRSVGDRVTAIATDRYRVGFQKIRPDAEPEPGFSAVIPLTVLARIRSIFKATKLHDPVLALTINERTLTVQAGDTLVDGFTGATLTFELPNAGPYPNIDVLLRDALNTVPDTEAVIGNFNPNFLADFRIGQPRGEAIMLSPTSGPYKPWIVRVGEDFIGLLIPIRRSQEPATDTGLWLSLLTPAAAVAA